MPCAWSASSRAWTRFATCGLSFPTSGSFRLGELGTVSDTVSERTQTATLSARASAAPNSRTPLPRGSDTVSLVIQKTSEGNTVQAAEGVKKQLEEVKRLLPADIQFTITSDQSERVHENLADVNVSLALGALLAV
jgi:HAE1 family hydrophobic/amphiphilic exporter-1